MRALQRLLALAGRSRIYLDITGDLVWRPAAAPRWYDRLPTAARWLVQERFWHAVARAAARYPAVLCYELSSEPTVVSSGGTYQGRIGDLWFIQNVASARGARADRLARAWTARLAASVHAEDDRPVSIGLLPDITGPFSPRNIGGLLDMLIVHEYPRSGEAAQAGAIVGAFAAVNKPVLLGETLMLDDDATMQAAFLSLIAPEVVGALEFYDGRDPRTLVAHTIYDAVYAARLDQFIALRPILLRG